MTTAPEDEALPAEAEKPPRFSKEKKIIAGAVAALLFAGGGGAALMLGGGEASEGEEATASEEHGEGGAESLVEVAPMVVNLRSSDGQARMLKLRIMLVAGSAEDVAVIDGKLPLIIDRYQPFLRELRPEDLAGSAAVYRLKEELVLRAADTVGAGVVSDVLIQDLIQQ